MSLPPKRPFPFNSAPLVNPSGGINNYMSGDGNADIAHTNLTNTFVPVQNFSSIVSSGPIQTTGIAEDLANPSIGGVACVLGTTAVVGSNNVVVDSPGSGSFYSGGGNVFVQSPNSVSVGVDSGPHLVFTPGVTYLTQPNGYFKVECVTGPIIFSATNSSFFSVDCTNGGINFTCTPGSFVVNGVSLA